MLNQEGNDNDDGLDFSFLNIGNTDGEESDRESMPSLEARHNDNSDNESYVKFDSK